MLTNSLRIVCLAVLVFTGAIAPAQDRGSALSEKEIEALRDAAYVPDDRVRTFIAFLDERTKDIQTVTARTRRPGREEDLHDLMEQFTAIADELSDNLDAYGPKHRDIRKSLPKLLAATEHWATILRTPPDDEAYSLSRKLALEAVRDLREESMRLIEDQKAWFLAHPPPKEDDKTSPDAAR